MPRTIDVSDLPESFVSALESLVSTYREHAAADSSEPQRPLGWLHGRVQVPDSFFEPLPGDLLGLFEGNGARS